jgi:hypothetical protein
MLFVGEVGNPHLPKATPMLEEVAQGLQVLFHLFMEKKKKKTFGRKIKYKLMG